jgi:hypothetical protein
VNTSQQNAAQSWGAENVSRRFAKTFTLTLTVMIVLLLGVSALAQSAVPYIYGPLSPGQKAPGSGTFTLTVYGTGFASGAVVNWNGKPLTTTFVTAEKLTASVPTANLTTAGTAVVTVTNGGVVSNPEYFQVVKNNYTVAWSKLDYATDTTPQDVTTADFNGDGNLDLAVATGNNSISMLLGNGTGSFPTKTQYAVPGNPVAIVHGDFNGDGKQDVATADERLSEISVLLGNGDGTLQTHLETATGAQPVALATADLNGDGKLDLVTANLNANTVSVLLGNGDGTFKTHKDYGVGKGPSAVAIGDFNGDGKLDLAVVNNTDATVSILLGNGDGTFQTAVPYTTAIGPNSVVVGNFTSADTLDVAVGTSNKLVSVLLGNGNGTLQNHKDYTIGANSGSIAAADLASNGKLSLVTANYNDNTISVLVGNGDGTFKGQSIFVTPAGPIGLAIGDFNNNGKLDIAVADYTANLVTVQTDSFLVLSPTINSFGTQTSGFASGIKTIQLKNQGTTSYTMGSLTTVGASSADFSQTNTCPAAGQTLAAGAACTYSNTFTPTASEKANAQDLLTSGDGSVIGWQMTGTGNIPIMLSPRTQTFPTTLLGVKSAGKTNTFTNVSGVNIYFTLIDLEGVNQNDFSFTSTCAGGGPPFNYSVPLLPGASCTSTVYFTPTMYPAGNETVTFVYYGNFTLVKQGLLINGEGTAVKVTPTSYTFPNTKIGQTSTKDITFQNAASVPLAISSIGWAGTGNYFYQTNTCNYPGGSVPANSSCTITVTFAPTVTGTFTATMSIGDADWTGPQVVSFTGTGTQ